MESIHKLQAVIAVSLAFTVSSVAFMIFGTSQHNAEHGQHLVSMTQTKVYGYRP